jgi:hypothetical protein
MVPQVSFISLVARDQWRRIYRSRGLAGLIGATTDRTARLRSGLAWSMS